MTPIANQPGRATRKRMRTRCGLNRLWRRQNKAALAVEIHPTMSEAKINCLGGASGKSIPKPGPAHYESTAGRFLRSHQAWGASVNVRHRHGADDPWLLDWLLSLLGQSSLGEPSRYMIE